MGALLEGVRRHLPGTYQAMATATRYWSTSDFQAHADYVQQRLFATVVNPTLEEDVYDPMILDFMSKLTVLRVIPAAVDFYGQTLATENIARPDRSDQRITYPERRDQLWELYNRLRGQVMEDWKPLQAKYGFQVWKTASTPAIRQASDDNYVTPDPYGMEDQIVSIIDGSGWSPFSGWSS